MKCRASCLVLVLAGCHVTSRSELTRPGKIERVRHTQGARAGRPTLVLTDGGALRAIEALACPTTETVVEQRSTELVTGPNLATFVVGVLATTVGGVLAVRGTSDGDGDGAAHPMTYAGGALLAVGIPFAIGPWIGNTTRVVERRDRAPVQRPGPSEPCGERPLAARTATLTVRGLEVHAAIDADGVLAVSPFELVDAFAVQPAPALAIAGRIDAVAGPRTVDVVLEGPALARHAPAFLARAGVDARIEPMRLVPGLVPGTVRASLTTTMDGDAVRIVLPIENQGPGPAWALRGQLVAPGTPAIDGRLIYIGHLPKGAAVARELLIPITRAVAAELRNATLELAVELHDAHGTAPTTPARFRGALLVDAPR